MHPRINQVYSTPNQVVEVQFYNKLSSTFEKIKPAQVFIVAGDLSARVGSSLNSKIVGQYGELTINNCGERLVELCVNFSDSN